MIILLLKSVEVCLAHSINGFLFEIDVIFICYIIDYLSYRKNNFEWER